MFTMFTIDIGKSQIVFVDKTSIKRKNVLSSFLHPFGN